MLKRFTKSGKKQNKSGVILVTILFILAVAFILIGAALIMTANTRKRLYSFAEGGQARVTCTAAAQLFQTALEEQQIRDSDFKKLCDAGTVVYFTDNSTTPVPGMGGTPTSSPTNYTQAKFGKSGTLYTVRITTRIGDEVENILLTYKGQIPTVQPSPFAFQVELGEGGRMDNVKIGGNVDGSGRVNQEDNIIVTRGDGSAPIGSCDFYSTFVTTTHMRSASGTHYYSDIVYAGDNAGIIAASGGGGTGSGAIMCDRGDGAGAGTAYFIDCDTPISGSGSTHEMFTGSTGAQVVFMDVGNSTFEQAFTGFTGPSIYQVHRDPSNGNISAQPNQVTITSTDAALWDGTGTSFHASNATGKDLAYYVGNLNQYLDPNYVDPDTGDSRPSSFYEFASAYSVINTSAAPTDASTPSLQVGTNNGTEYRLSGPIDGVYNVELDGTNDCVIYITGDVTFHAGGFIKVSGGNGTNTGSRCYIVIGRGFKISFDSNGADCGIISENVHSGTSINQTQAPCTYIIGSGLNGRTGLDARANSHGQIEFQPNSTSGEGTIEAMVALYPYKDDTNDAGDIYAYEGVKVHFYGRVIAHTIYAKTGGHIVMPYCPQFSGSEDPDGLYRVTTNFKLQDFDYYYDDGSTHVLTTAPSST